ncbi:MAG: acyltransferase family protein [Hyphomicrobium sp.]|nr:acyltransferase family protein [Hyphomicrobium sp.]
MQDARGYIPAVDGLRAVAVLAVLLFHFEVNGFAGGFLGVDVFFVISGYVITRSIAKELSEGTFSLKGFYVRRIARLMPANLAMLAATLVCGYFVLSPDELERLGRVAILAAMSLSNFFFWMDAGYFDTGAAYKPLLHTWSLSVEEQFYLVWPLLLLFCLRFGRTAAMAVMLALGLAAVAASLFGGFAEETVFFMMPFRVHQFAVGALLALSGARFAGWFASIALVVGLAALGVLFSLVDDKSGFILNSVAPALAAGLIITSAQSAAAERILASAPMLWIGRRSYSIYLVHWPIVVLWNMATDLELSATEQVAGLVASIALGAALYTLVEKPLRFRPGLADSDRQRSIAVVMAGLVGVLFVGAHYWGLRGFPERVPTELYAALSDINGGWKARMAELRTGKCNFTKDQVKPEQFDRTLCTVPRGARDALLVIGDSFGSDTYLVIRKAFPDLPIGQVTLPGCLLRMPARITNAEPCRRLYQLAIEDIALNGGYSAVVLAANWPEGRYEIVDELIAHFEKHGVPVILVGQHVRFAHPLPRLVGTSLTREQARTKAAASLLPTPARVNRELEKRFGSRTYFLDFMDLQCPSACTVFDPQGRLMYLDDSHVSLAGAAVLATRLKAKHPRLGHWGRSGAEATSR